MRNSKYRYYYESRSGVPYPRNSRKIQLSFGTVLISVLTLAFLCSLSAYIGIIYGKRNVSGDKKTVVILQEGNTHSVSGDAFMTVDDVIETTKPSLVQITTDGGEDDNFKASGVIWAENGIIVTSGHIAEKAWNISVKLSDEREFKVVSKYIDGQTNLAVLQIDARGLTPVLLGNSEGLCEGQRVVIGNPYRTPYCPNDCTVRGISGSDDYDEEKNVIYFNTNEDLYIRNAGGGLFNLYGELVGIVFVDGGGEEGGFLTAITAKSAKGIVKDLLEYGYVTGRVDNDIFKFDELISDGKGFISFTGLKVTVDNLKGEIRVNDYIAEVDGVAITTKAEWYGILMRKKVGETLHIRYLRGNNYYECYIMLPEKKTP